MKKLTCLFTIALACSSVLAQSSKPDWSATIKVIDETSQPVTGADVEMSYYVQPPPGEHEAGGNVHGLTDINGVVRLSHSNTGSIGLGFQATKAGYYATTKGHEFVQFKDSDSAKWNPNETLMIKRVGTPIAMYAKSVNLGMPVFDKPAGFDLMAGDWVAPYGKGASTDIIFTGHFDKHADGKSDYTLTVSFPNRGDGIQEFSIDRNLGNSGLQSSHEASADGYQPKFVQTENRGLNRNYYFRVRTVLDENGNVKSALYGKTYGDFMQFKYYLNPTPNDRNIEFDPKHNLLGGLKSFEGVSAP
jgi:hypothetical protein